MYKIRFILVFQTFRFYKICLEGQLFIVLWETTSPIAPYSVISMLLNFNGKPQCYSKCFISNYATGYRVYWLG